MLTLRSLSHLRSSSLNNINGSYPIYFRSSYTSTVISTAYSAYTWTVFSTSTLTETTCTTHTHQHFNCFHLFTLHITIQLLSPLTCQLTVQLLSVLTLTLQTLLGLKSSPLNNNKNKTSSALQITKTSTVHAQFTPTTFNTYTLVSTLTDIFF